MFNIFIQTHLTNPNQIKLTTHIEISHNNRNMYIFNRNLAFNDENLLSRALL